MRANSTLVILVVVSSAMSCAGQSPLPASDLSAVTARIQRDFSSVDEIHTIGMTDDPDGRFDVVVVGSSRGGGWRVEALSVEHHRLAKKWDSDASAKGVEFDVLGLKGIDVREKDYDYDIVMSGCAPHQCGDGINGFLVFSGGTGMTHKAKVVTRDLDKPPTGPPTYDVTFSPEITAGAKKILQSAICASNSISNKQGLPFVCRNP
jgi:hypothetical protein